MDGLEAARRMGLEVIAKYGLFRTVKGLQEQNPTTFMRRSREQVEKFVRKFEKEGWKLTSNPVAERLKPTYDTEYVPVQDTKGTATLWKPTSTQMRPDHPFFEPDVDLYEVRAYFSRAPRRAVWDISEDVLKRLINSGKLPTSVKLAE